MSKSIGELMRIEFSMLFSPFLPENIGSSSARVLPHTPSSIILKLSPSDFESKPVQRMFSLNCPEWSGL